MKKEQDVNTSTKNSPKKYKDMAMSKKDLKNTTKNSKKNSPAKQTKGKS